MITRNNTNLLRSARVQKSWLGGTRWRYFSSRIPQQPDKGDKNLSIRCECGKVGWDVQGPPVASFVTHSSAPRHASGKSCLPMTVVLPHQLSWVGENDAMQIEGTHGVAKKLQPPNSTNEHFFCPCESRNYMGVDVSKWIGGIALNLDRATTAVHEPMFTPNHHVFYSDRTTDEFDKDGLRKWATVPGGEVISSTAMDSSTLNAFEPTAKLPSPYRPSEPKEYHFHENNPYPNHSTVISSEALSQRVKFKYENHIPEDVTLASKQNDWKKLSKETWDAIIVGGGHNGLTCAAYLAKAGKKVLVLERRSVLGGAAVSEEMYPGFTFSRASYLAGLLRPSIIKDLELEKYGFEYLDRDPSSFTPSLKDDPVLQGKYLILGHDDVANKESIRQFSDKDAEAFPKYEEFLGKIRQLVQPLLDAPPPNPFGTDLSWRERVVACSTIWKMVKVAIRHPEIIVPFYELLTGPAAQILDRWFESEILKATLATDAVIGALLSPKQNGSAYVLLHHVMGEANGRQGVWAYVKGGMGSISNAIASSAKFHGAEIHCDTPVSKLRWEAVDRVPQVTGVELPDGSVVSAPIVVSGCSPYHTFMELMEGLAIDGSISNEFANVEAGNTNAESKNLKEFVHHLKFQDFACGAFKINCAVDSLPNFTCYPNETEIGPDGTTREVPGPQHRGTIHFESRMDDIENSYREASAGIPATCPVIEMTIPSAVDPSVAPVNEGKHVVQLFVQFAPYEVDPKLGHWKDESFKQEFVNRVYSIVDKFAPGFSQSVLYQDVLSPLDLERVFGLHRGNIFHGSLSLHQLGFARPMAGFSNHRSPVKGLFMASAGTHPGGGVMGATGKNCAQTILAQF